MKLWIPVGCAVVVTVVLFIALFPKLLNHTPVVSRPTPRPAQATPPPTSSSSSAGQMAIGLDPGTLTLVGWNVESGGALETVVSARMAAFDGVDVWGLSEVREVDAESFEFGAEEGEAANFDTLVGTTGGADRLMLTWDADRFEQTGAGELHEIALGGRAPLYVQLRNQKTLDEVIVMVNHLNRADDRARLRQAQMLNVWAADQELPLIALGDFNYDWDLTKGETNHGPGYDAMTADGVWQWVRPEMLVTTQCSGWPCRYESILDFVFVAGPAQTWPAQAKIIVAEHDFPDDNTTPDHRPVWVRFWTAPHGGPVSTSPTANGSARLRSGPGVHYLVVGRTQEGQPLTIVARDESGNWLQLESGEWIATFFVRNAPEGLPVAAPVATPEGTPSPDPVGLRLGEIVYDGEVPQVESDEYVEIVNEGVAINLAGWQLSDDDGSVFVFPDYVMQPGVRCRVYTNEVHAESCGFSFGSGQGIWTNSGDVAILLDPAGHEVERHCWKDACQ